MPQPIRAIAAAALCLAACLGCGSNQAFVTVSARKIQPPQVSGVARWPGDPPYVVAVLPFQRNDPPMEPNYAIIRKGGEEALTVMVERGLLAVPWITVVARRDVEQIKAELAFQHSAWADETQRRQIGRLLGADFLLTGQVKRYCAAHEKLERGARAEVASVEFSVAIIHVETGQKVWSCAQSGDGRMMLQRPQEVFPVDWARDTIAENESGARARLMDVDLLARRLVDSMIKALLETTISPKSTGNGHAPATS